MGKKNLVDLIYFLEDGGYYEQYKEAIKGDNDPLPEGLPDLDGMIGEAFSWSHTDEGHEFWDQVEDEWLTLLEHNYIGVS